MNKEELIGKLEMVYVGDRNALEEMVGYYDGLKQGIEELQQESKQLKEQLLVTQTNEETYRLEMKDITQTLGLDEDTIFDDVKAYVKSLEIKNRKYKEVIDKAREYINKMFETGFYNDDYYLGHLKQILQDKEAEQMNKEDYSKYYIQGSDHYLIPKDVFNELFDEMENWKEESKELNQKYLNAVADYETTMAEKEQLNSLVNSCQEEIRRLKKQLEECKHKGLYNTCLPYSTGYNKAIKDKENQQKEFIDYMENKIYSIEPKGTGINYNCEYDSEEDFISAMEEQSRLNTLKEILSKYKKIIGGKE